jgi:hypothetical protein
LAVVEVVEYPLEQVGPVGLTIGGSSDLSVGESLGVA